MFISVLARVRPDRVMIDNEDDLAMYFSGEKKGPVESIKVYVEPEHIQEFVNKIVDTCRKEVDKAIADLYDKDKIKGGQTT